MPGYPRVQPVCAASNGTIYVWGGFYENSDSSVVFTSGLSYDLFAQISLVLVLWLRDRIHEIGIMLSIGKSKVEIIIQFIFELVFISIPSGIILCAYSVIKHNALCFTLSYGLLMSIIIVSVLIASLMIMIKKPREILSKLS